ncbi:MAG: SCP2 sterol-binding domain-containing protein [Gammaproteobacteria bacterium]|nr:SCP2 sterol-binding domain-containing protein [Gammaproteobacteria bacterium]
MTLPNTLINLLEKAFNHYLSLDPLTPEKLTQLDNKIIAVELTDASQTLYFTFTDQHVEITLTLTEPESANTIIKGSLFSLAKIGLEKPSSASIFSSNIEIQGDTELGKQFQKMLQEIDIDWEEQLSHYTGDVIAHQAGSAARTLQDWAKQTFGTLKQNTTEYLQEESRDLPHPIEVNTFLSDVDQLRMDIDRLEARIHRLQNNK